MIRLACTVLWKELTESLRDAHVLIVSLGFPLLIYPLLALGTTQVMLLREGAAEQSPPRIVVVGPKDAAVALDGSDVRLVPRGPMTLAAARGLIEGGEADVVVTYREASVTSSATVLYLSTSPVSAQALRDYVEPRLEVLRGERATDIAVAAGVSLAAPFLIESEDVDPPSRSMGYALSLAVPLFVFIAMLIGAIYPAIEVVVGERERGSLETTLSTAAPRGAILLGKIATVVVLATIATVGSGVGLSLTLFHFIYQLVPDLEISLELSTSSVIGACVTQVATLLLLSALLVLGALPARSFKEAQNVLTVVMLVVMALVVPGFLPLTELTSATALVPVGNGVLVLRDAIRGAPLQPVPVALSILLNLGLAALFFWLAVRVSASESFLFGGRVPRWLRWLRRDRGGR